MPAEAPKPLARNWEPDYLVKWLFGQTDIWITAAGVVVQIESMDPEHALNTLCFLERVADDLPFPRENLQSYPLYGAIRARVLDILVPPPEPQFIAAPAGPRWLAFRHRIEGAPWAVYKLMDDGQVEWDAPFSQADAEAKAEQRNRDAEAKAEQRNREAL